MTRSKGNHSSFVPLSLVLRIYVSRNKEAAHIKGSTQKLGKIITYPQNTLMVPVSERRIFLNSLRPNRKTDLLTRVRMMEVGWPRVTRLYQVISTLERGRVGRTRLPACGPTNEFNSLRLPFLCMHSRVSYIQTRIEI